MSSQFLPALFLIGLVSEVGAQNLAPGPRPSPRPIDPSPILTPPAAPARTFNAI